MYKKIVLAFEEKLLETGAAAAVQRSGLTNELELQVSRLCLYPHHNFFRYLQCALAESARSADQALSVANRLRCEQALSRHLKA